LNALALGVTLAAFVVVMFANAISARRRIFSISIWSRARVSMGHMQNWVVILWMCQI
jgi:hypothetical protein